MVETLREARQRLGIGVRRLSKGAPVSPRTVYQVERRETVPQVETIRKLSRFLGVEPMEIQEFADSLTAQGLEEMPEEPEFVMPTTARAKMEAAGWFPGEADPRQQALTDLKRLMQDVGRLDSARVYEEVFGTLPG